MSLSDATRQKIQSLVDQNRVVLFMKGSPSQPLCGFSARTAGILDNLLDDYASVDVLADEEIREGIKAYGNWPTIPQLYVDGELVGGCDIVVGMFNTGELHEHLGLDKPDRTPPEITITAAAAGKITEAMDGHEGIAVHLQIDPDWSARFSLAPAQGGEISVKTGGIEVLLDLASAQRARGAVIDWVSTMQGEGLSIDLPGAPPPVHLMNVRDLAAKLAAGEVTLIDVRPADEREKAAIDGALAMDADLMDRLEAMPKDTPIAFHCHSGGRSQVAAEHFRKLGFTRVSNVAGGIDAWSREIDAEVPLY
jgi:monothiol glutaredoxin